jgi:hypothetical protein
MKKTFYETLWSLLEKQGILEKWFEEGLLVTKNNTTFWTPKALEILGLEESIGGVNLSDKPGKKPREVEVDVEFISLCTNYTSKFSARAIGIAGKGGNLPAVTKKMQQFLKEYDYTHQEILLGVDLYFADLRKTNAMRYVQEGHYFISKIIDKAPVSNLAKWCEEARNNKSGANNGYTSHTVL